MIKQLTMYDITNPETYKWYHHLKRIAFKYYGIFFLELYCRIFYRWDNKLQYWILDQAGYSRHPLVEYYYEYKWKQELTLNN